MLISQFAVHRTHHRLAEVSPKFARNNTLHLEPLERLTSLVQSSGLVVHSAEAFRCQGDYSDRKLGMMQREFLVVVARKPAAPE